MSRTTVALLSFVVGLVYADLTRPYPEYLPASAGASIPKSRPCGGLWVRQESAKFRGAIHCVPSADMTKRRPLPSHILTMPIKDAR